MIDLFNAIGDLGIASFSIFRLPELISTFGAKAISMDLAVWNIDEANIASLCQVISEITRQAQTSADVVVSAVVNAMARLHII